MNKNDLTFKKILYTFFKNVDYPGHIPLWSGTIRIANKCENWCKKKDIF